MGVFSNLFQIDEAKRTIKSPSVVDGELEPDSTFWCHFCGIQVIKHMTDRNTSVQFGGVFEHLARYLHMMSYMYPGHFVNAKATITIV